MEMERFARWSLAIVPAVLALCSPMGSGAPVLEAITFAAERGKIYVPLEEAARALSWRVRHNGGNKRVQLKGTAIPSRALRTLLDGTELVRLGHLEDTGAQVTRHPSGKVLNVGTAGRYFTATVDAKRAEVNLAKQRLRCWQGKRLVLESRVSSGRRGSTPAGSFRAGPYKARHHYSSRYDNAYMPWSVQVTGHVFIHGFKSVPRYPASHGCIRLPVNEGNPARFFYEWIDKGTPIRVVRK